MKTITDDKEEKPQTFWLVMKLQKWSSLETSLGRPLACHGEGYPSHFMPVFDSRKEAIDWCDGNETYVKEVSTVVLDTTKL